MKCRTCVLALLVLLSVGFVSASSHDAYSAPRTGFSVSGGVSVDDTAVYSTGYVSQNGSLWQQFSLTGDRVRGEWVLDSASSSVDLSDIRYVAIFSCTWSDGWDCSETWQVRDRGVQNTVDSKAGDEEALEALYAAAGGSGWTDQNGWGADMDLSQPIDRVTVETIDGEPRVTQIDLRNNGLTGSIDVPELANLKQLRLFAVMFNNLDSTLPEELGQAKDLEYLYLSRSGSTESMSEYPHEDATSGSGDVHPGKRKGSESNIFRGPIPVSYGNLQELKWFVLDWTDSAEGAADGITQIPEELFSIQTIQGLHIFNNNNIADFQMPATVCEMTQLTNLAIGVEKSGRGTGPLTGNLPDCFGKDLGNLRHLRLGENSKLITDFDTVDFSGLRSIMTFGLGWTQPTGTLPDYFFNGSMPELIVFGVSLPQNGAGVQGPLPQVAPEMDMHIYHFARNKLTSLPASAWTSNTKIIQPALNDNQLTTIGTADLTQQDRLRYLRLGGNELHEPWPYLDWDTIAAQGGLDGISFDENRYVFKHMLYIPPNGDKPIIEYYNDMAAARSTNGRLDYSPQKPFGQAASYTVNTAGDLTIDDFSSVVEHADNQYQWQKDASPISGATGRELTISDAQAIDAGEYTLVVTNPGAPDLTLTSEPITLSVTDASTGSAQGDYDTLMDLYAATDGDGWWDDTGWSSSTPQTMDSMYGISVYPDGHEFAGRVREIDLFQNNLVGTIDSVPWEQLTALESLKLKQPLTAEEFFAGDPVGQVAQNPPPKLSGQLPASLGELTHLKWLSLGGQFGDIELVPAPPAFNYWNYNTGIEGGKKYVNGNFFTGQLPPEWGGLESLEMLEIRASDLDGQVPVEWEAMSNIRGIFLNDNYLTGPLPTFKNADNLSQIFLNFNRKRNSDVYVGFSGPIPESYAQFPLNHLQLAYNNLSGVIPVFDQADDLHVFNVGRNDLTRFPKEVFEDGRNPSLNYFHVENNPVDATLADVSIDPDAHNLKVFDIAHTNIGGALPSWASQIGLKQFNFQYSSFTGLGDGFYEADAPVYHAVRNMRLNNNQLQGELPDVLFAAVSHEGTAVSMPSSDAVELSMDLGVVESGTVSDANHEWIRDRSKIDQWSGGWGDHTIIVDPDGKAITWEVGEDTNYESGYIYSRTRADPSGTEGDYYELRPAVVGRVIRFKLGENRWAARKIVDVDYDTNQVTLDKPLDVNVAGKPFVVHASRSITLLMYYHGNQLTGPIPQSWAYVPTHRDAQVYVQDNELSGEVPDLSGIGADNGGSLDRLQYQDNRFVFRDILPNFAANDAAASYHRYAPQKPFGAARTASVSAGGSFSHDFSSAVSHPDNVYQWERDGSAVSGQTSTALSLSSVDSEDAGTYRLRVTNPGAPDLTLYSEEVTLSVS